ncbi:MAG: hypothetical protein HGB18_04775, partial [Candidatus Moranbacteria bacterium]|nr:hypothetical protein [Candidatus Moranbacteria bacterium]
GGERFHLRQESDAGAGFSSRKNREAVPRPSSMTVEDGLRRFLPSAQGKLPSGSFSLREEDFLKRHSLKLKTGFQTKIRFLKSYFYSNIRILTFFILYANILAIRNSPCNLNSLTMNIWIFFGKYTKIAAIVGVTLIATAIFGSIDEPKNAFIGGVVLLLTAATAFLASRKKTNSSCS